MSKVKKSKRPKAQTPLMKQYWAVKERYPGTVLLFRMGDFYETFDDDARLVHRILGLTLTKRANGQASDVALAGFPHHAIDNYLPKLIRAGLRVAICEQLEEPQKGKKIVDRDVVEVVTPGVSFRDQLLDPKRSQYLAAVHRGRKKEDRDHVGIAFADISTGAFFATEVPYPHLSALLHSIAPAEIVVESGHADELAAARAGACVVTKLDDWVFKEEYCRDVLTTHFETHSLKGYGIEDLDLGVVAAGAVLHYLQETQKGRLPHIRNISRFEPGDFMLLDEQTRRNLELVSSLQSGGTDGTLVTILDQTSTSMGARMLRSWLVRPLKSLEDIRARQQAVEAFVDQTAFRDRMVELFDPVHDLERLAAKVSLSRVTPRDLVSLRDSLVQIPLIKSELERTSCPELQSLGDRLVDCADVVDWISRTLVDDPPVSLKDGGVIRKGVSPELDDLRQMARSGKQWLADLQESESRKTGISSLKIGFNKVFGYYLEVTHTHKNRVPEDWIRKQTLVNAERYITEELKEYEERILGAEEKMAQMEADLFRSLCEEIAGQVPIVQKNAGLLARLDVLISFAIAAVKHKYVKPTVTDQDEIRIQAGRHPVVEQALPLGEPFIPNDIVVNSNVQQILVITGPNMAGKSVVLRQVGLIVLMAQVGSYVPAEKATIGLVDRIFTRVGASDNLAAGESTFLVEMNETANILNNATARSLILLDEVGRGTSTFDGLSIAWSLVEYLHNESKVAARTLFATHYHELNELADRLERVRNYRIQVQEHAGTVVFLRKLVVGGADHSYGIEVARMAGLPEELLVRARQILNHLESQRLTVEEALEEAGIATTGLAIPDASPNQMSLFSELSDPVAAEIRERIEALDTDRITPIDALIALSELKRLANDR